jgi:predicted alpha/beta-hydrolase family hydrolase
MRAKVKRSSAKRAAARAHPGKSHEELRVRVFQPADSQRGAGASAPTLVLAHGAGAGSAHPWIQGWAKALAARGLRVLTFDFPYIRAGRKLPDRAPVLEGEYRAVVAKARAKFPGARLFLGGKSMGGRIASHLAAAGEVCDGLVFFGYPLHPPAKPEKRRDEHLGKITVPMLFVQGERDPFGGKDEIAPLAKKLGARAVFVPEGDHSLEAPKRSGWTEERVREMVGANVAAFVVG